MRVHFEGRDYEVEGQYWPADVTSDADGRIADRFPAEYQIESVDYPLDGRPSVIDNPAFIEACVKAYEEENNGAD